MASFRGVKIKDNVITRDDSVAEEVWFDECALREVTKIGDWCFGLGQHQNISRHKSALSDRAFFRPHHASKGPSVLDLSLLVNCKVIGAGFAVGHYGPIIFPPALKSVGFNFLIGLKCRVLVLPEFLETIGGGSFAYAAADRIVFSPRLTSLSFSCFEGACISALEIPGSVEVFEHGFWGATIGTLTFAESNCDSLPLNGWWFKDATVQTLNIKRGVQLMFNGRSRIPASANIVVLRYLLRTELRDAATDAASLCSSDQTDLHVGIRAVVLGNRNNACLFPNSIVTIDEDAVPAVEPARSRATPSRPPLELEASDVDLATLEVFEDKHRSLVQNGATIDMRGLVKCRKLGARCFAGLTGVSALWLPPNLSEISEDFMWEVNVPQLDIVFPPSLREVGATFLFSATVRSVDFAASDGLTVLRDSLINAAILSFTFPPKIEEIGSGFMESVNAPNVDLMFPETILEFRSLVLSHATLRSVNFSKCDSVSIGSCFLNHATVEEIVFPPAIRDLGRDFMREANSPQLDLVLPPSLEDIPKLFGVTVRSVDCSVCRVHEMGVGHLEQATFESYVFFPDVTSIGGDFMAGAVAPKLDLVFPSAVTALGQKVLQGAVVRSVNFSNCDALQSISRNCLASAAVASVSLPPNLHEIEVSALSGIRGENVTITLPESLQDIGGYVLEKCCVKSIDMSAAKSVTEIPVGFCSRATVTGSFKMPPRVASLRFGAFSDFTCTGFRFDASPSLEDIGADVFRGAKIATVTITDSPKLETVSDNFLSAATLKTPASLVFADRLTSVGTSFCAGTPLQRLDMHQCDKVSTLPDNFLLNTDCARPVTSSEAGEASEGRVFLPPKVVTYGDQCFTSSKGVTNIPVNKSSLKVGHSFGADSDIDRIPWTGSWVAVGHGFCKNVKVLDIVDMKWFYSVGDDFCRGVGKLTIDFSHFAATSLGAGFLQGATVSSDSAIDLSRCSFTECPAQFMYRTRFEGHGGEVMLPPAVSSIGAQCCAEAQLEDISIAGSKTCVSRQLVIQDDFLRGCVSLKSVTLPATVTSFGDGCFQGCPMLEVSLSLPMVSRIGNDFCAGNQSSMASAATSGGSKDPAVQHEDSSSPVVAAPRTTVSLNNVCPHVQIGDNFLAHADCTSLEFGTIGSVAVEKDKLVVDLEAALSTAHGACSMSDGAVVLKELIALRKMTITKMVSAMWVFRPITTELNAIEAQKDLSDRTARVDALLKELLVEVDFFFRHDPKHQYEWAREALQRHEYGGLLGVLEGMDRLVDQECKRDLSRGRQDANVTSPKCSDVTIGDNFLAGTIGLTKLDMSHALHTAIGKRFATKSALREVHLPPSVTVIGEELCRGCLATVAAAPQSTGRCYISAWMDIRVEKERVDTLIHFRELLPASEQSGMARWLLEQKRFAEFKGVFNVRDDATNLRYVGGAVDDLPEIPNDVPKWLGFNMKITHHDDGLSLLHWAVKYSRQFAHLLSEVSWSLRDLSLVTEQGFTALHYAVLYDIEAAALGTLLSIAAKAEIHRTWSDAWGAGGVRVSPLHLAYLYRRDGIVKELLAFEWDPTDAIKPSPAPNDAGTLFDAFDQSIMELGQARALGSEDEQAAQGGVQLPVPVQLFHASVLMCVCDALETDIYRGRATDHAIQRAFVTLRCHLSADFPLLSPNKWAEARAQQLALAEWGHAPSTDDKDSFGTQEEFLQAAFASALSDSAHGPNVRLRYHQLLATSTSLEAFVVSQVENLPDVPTHEFVKTLSVHVRALFDRICRSRPNSAAPKISAETLLLRTRSMEEGPHRDKVEDKLSVVIPFRFVIPVLPFFYLTLMMVFGMSWFFHPPILEPTLMGIENAIADCTNPYNTKDATEDGVIPWDCSVGFTELGMQIETFQNQTQAAPQMASFFSFIEKGNIPQNVTHLPWAYLRFATIVTYNGLKTKASSVADAEMAPEDTAQKYWVLTELRKLPDWAPEIFEQKNTKANESTISFKGETTRTFAHTVVPYQFGNHTLLGAWMAGVAALLLACVVAFVYHGYAFAKIVAEREVRLVEVTTVQRSLRSILLACEFAAVVFIAVGLVIMTITFDQHRTDDLISRSTAAQWQRAEIFFRVGLTFCSFRAVSFFSEMPKPHHFAMVNAGVVGVGLIAALVSLLLLPTSRVGIVASLKSLLSIQAVDALTLPVILAVSLFLRSSKVTDEVRQAHYDNLREDMGEDEAGSTEPSAGREVTLVLADGLSRQDSMVERGKPPYTALSVGPNAEELLSEPEARELSVSDGSAGDRAAGVGKGEEVELTEVQPFTKADSHGDDGKCSVGIDDRGRYPSSDDAVNTHSAPPPASDAAAPVNRDAHQDLRTISKQMMKDRAAAVRSRARRRWALSWAVIVVAGLGQVLLYGLAVTVVVRPLLTLPAPGGVLPVTGDSFLSSDDLGMVGFARRFFF